MTAPTRFAVEATLAEIRAAGAGSYESVRPLDGGMQGGAWLVTDERGSHAVLKRANDDATAARMIAAEPAVARAVAAGYPTPPWRAAGMTPSGTGYVIMERAPGAPVERLTAPVAERLIRTVELQGNVDPLPGRNWSDHVGSWYSERVGPSLARVRALGPGGARLAAACAAVQALVGQPRLRRADLVHGDLRLANVLFERGHVSGVVDVEALGSGSRAFDYATVLDSPDAEDDALELVVEAGSEVDGADALLSCAVLVFLDLALFVADVPTPVITADARAADLAARLGLVRRLAR
ncbi:phosphotransferase family enzyme [Salana multivorans]|uniref:Phosphotransferase family enzyme n=1 Tax=Salana multivorans TaxID=120377 RepID=A0A3N2D1M4_9MICO|nr:phosphotransferase [Salana multivorans]ROR93682.1 phosphotransferase family enzyme [Salana multivorans]